MKFNSVVLIPDLISADDCAKLVAEVEAEFELRKNSSDHACLDGQSDYIGGYGKPIKPFQKFPVFGMSEPTQAIFETLLRERLLPFVRENLPGIAKEEVEADVPLKFSKGEPAINRYSVGGEFTPHTDKLTLTFNVLLSEGDGAFEGGGTEFWLVLHVLILR